MTVAELIAELQHMPQQAQIQVSYIASDYWKTRICKDIGDVEKDVVVEYSDYHSCDKVSEDEFQEMNESMLDSSKHSKIVLINL